MVEQKLRANTELFKARYLGYEIAWFFDAFQKSIQVNNYVNYSTLKLQFYDHVFDNQTIHNHFNYVYGKQPNEFDNNYTGFILVSGYKTLFSLIKEIIKERKFKDFLDGLFGEEITEKLDILYRFLRNFWLHNIEQDFGIQDKDYKDTYRYMIEKSKYCKQGKLYLNLIHRNIINISLTIDFNTVKGKNIFEVIGMKEHLVLLHVFYNLCSLYEDSLQSN